MRQHVTTNRWLRLWALLLAMVLVLAACGQADDDEDTDELAEPDLEEPADEPEATPDEPTDDEATEDGAAADGEPLVIGRISALEGAFAAGAEDGERAVEMVLEEFGYESGGRPIETIVESSDTTPETAVDRARKLVEQDGVSIIHGPLSGSEGVALKDYAKSVPHVTFVDAASGGTPTTLEDPSENYFRFHAEGSMWMSPLGPYVVENLGYNRIVTLAEDYAFPHSQVGGFLEGYCGAGGELVDTFWVPLGESDYSSVIASIPQDIDAIYVSVGGSDAVDFLSQAIEFGLDLPIIGGSILVDETVLGSEGQIRDSAVGTVASGPIPPYTADIPEWQDFIANYQEMFPDAFDNPTLFATLYYNSFRSLMLAIDEVGGAVEEDDGESLREALSNLEWESPIGPLSLNENRQAETNVFIYEVVEGEGEELSTELLEVAGPIEQGDTVWERLDECP